MRHCQGITHKGKRCTFQTIDGEKYCKWHRKGPVEPMAKAKRRKVKAKRSPAYDMITGLVRYIDQQIEARLQKKLEGLLK